MSISACWKAVLRNGADNWPLETGAYQDQNSPGMHLDPLYPLLLTGDMSLEWNLTHQSLSYPRNYLSKSSGLDSHCKLSSTDPYLQL